MKCSGFSLCTHFPVRSSGKGTKYIYVFLMTKQYFGSERKTDEKGTCTYNFHATENHTLRKDAFMCVCFLWKKKSILNTYLKMFLNKCLLFKELQLHLKQLSTRKAKLCWHRPFSSTAFARLSYTESRAGLFSCTSAWVMQSMVLLHEWFVYIYIEAKLSFRSHLETSEQTPKAVFTHTDALPSTWP